MHATAACFTIVLSLGLAPAKPSPEATDSALAEQCARLDAKHEKSVRMEALGRIQSHWTDRHALQAVPALERCVRTDPDADVRGRAVQALCHVLKHAEKPCPPAVVEALLDKEDEVRWNAMACMAFFKTYEPGCVEVLLRGVESDKADARSDSLLILGHAGAGDKRAIEAMEKATRDKVFNVRHSARIALFHAKNRLDEHIPYLIRLREDPESVLSPVPEDPEAANRDRVERNLVAIGNALQMIDWSETRSDELAPLLMKLSEHESAVMRRGAVNLIGACVVKVKLPPKREGSLFNLFDAESLAEDGTTNTRWPWMIQPEPEPKKEEPKAPDPPEKSAVALKLEKLKVKKRLRELRDNDPDESVRAAARLALTRWATVQKAQRSGAALTAPNGPTYGPAAR